MKIAQLLLVSACLLSGIPGLAAVNISSPTNGSSVTSPVQVSASVRRHQPVSLTIYVNDAPVLERDGVSSIATSLNLDPGNYTIKVQAQYPWRATTSTTNITVVGSSTGVPGGDTPSGGTPSGGLTVADQIAADMQGSNEGLAHGIPLSWNTGPVISMGNNSNGWQAITAWGVVNEAAEGNPASNTRVNIRNVQLFFLHRSTGTWDLLQSTSAPDGEAYYEDYAGDFSKPADVRSEPDGSISVTAGGGFNFHFYPSVRGSIDPNDIGGIVAVFQARLILGDPNGPDDRGIARYLADAGADYYPGLTGGWPGTATFNPGVGGGKLKYVKSDWRSFSMTTMTQSQLESNPPPVNLAGVLP